MRDTQPNASDIQEQQTSDSGNLPGVWGESIPDREEIEDTKHRTLEAGRASGMPFLQVAPLGTMRTTFQEISMEMASQTKECHTQALELMFKNDELCGMFLESATNKMA